MGEIVFCAFLILTTIFLTQGARIDFYEHAGFRGRILRVDVDSNCQNLPQNWSRQISALRSWGCAKFYMDTECKAESVTFHDEDVKELVAVWTTARKHHRYWRSKHWNDKIMSFGPCENKSDKEATREIATRYLEEIYKRTISVNRLRRIGKDERDHIYNPNKWHHMHE